MRNFVTTSIPYINESPHIGHIYEFILADIFARYKRSNDEEMFFQSGTDENGLKIVKSAEEKGKDVKNFVDEKHREFYELKEKFNLSFDKFIRTTSQEHKLGVYKFWKLCEKDIYVGEYKGFYCISCENYYDESEAKDLICPIHKNKLEKFEEKNYFFKLSKYLNEVKDLIEKDRIKIYPEEKKIEVLNILKEGKLKDLSISRDTQRSKGWGIPVYNDNTQVIYVWFDALLNYLTGLGFGSKDESLFEKFWNEGNIYHFIGKDILKFHAIYWPAMLLSAGIKTPENIVVHFHITIEGEKMSKTLGNVISPEDFLKKYHYEAVRFYFAHQPVFKDWNFSWDDFENFYQGVLKKDLANLILRIFGILNKVEAKEIKIFDTDLDHHLKEFENNFKTKMENLEFDPAYDYGLSFLHFVNKFIDQNKVWETKKESDLGFLIKSLLLIIKIYSPLLPETLLSLQEKIKIKDKIYSNNKIDLKPFYK
jgi:methionyl-tRNA synthetase